MPKSDTRQTADNHIAKLTEAVVEILNNPLAPIPLYDAVLDSVLELQQEVPGWYANPIILRAELPLVIQAAIRHGNVVTAQPKEGGTEA